MSLKTIQVLLVEDSPTDVLLTQEAFAHCTIPFVLHVVDNGVEALEFLRGQDKYATAPAPRPDLILLDLNMPRKNGQEVLAELKADEALKAIPIVILTTSKAGTDIAKAYGHHANCYITKPIDFDTFTEAIRAIQDFWFSVVTLPPA